MNLKYEDYPELFDAINNEDYDPYHRDKVHRRGSNFFTVDIIEIDEAWKEYVPSLTEEYYGFWQTSQFIWDGNYGRDEDIYELTKVEKQEVITKTIVWNPIK